VRDRGRDHRRDVGSVLIDAALLTIAADAARDRLGTDLVAFDVAERLALADAFLLVSGRNERQVASIAEEIEERMLAAGSKVLRREGRDNNRWVLLDFGDLIVHVFHEEDRMYYGLERLWRDCPVLPLPEPAGPDADAERDEPGPVL